MPEAPQPSQQDTDNQALSPAEILKKAQEAGAEQAQENKEQRAERKSIAREKTKAAWNKTKEVGRNISNTVRGLADKDVQGEMSKFLTEKIDAATDKLGEKYESIADKAEEKREAAMKHTREEAGYLVDKIKDRFITKRVEKVKGMGPSVKEYFSNKGKNVVDRHHMNQAYAEADKYQNKAEKYEYRAQKREAHLKKIAAKRDRAAEADRPTVAGRLGKKADRISARHEKARLRAGANKERAKDVRDKADRFRANIKGRSKK